MSKNNENRLVPKLRFPEFLNDGEWKDYTIDSIGEVVTGGTPNKEEKEYWGGDFVWATAQDFKKKYISDSVLKLTQKGKEKSRIIPKDSVLVTCIASIGLNAINRVECATNQQINSIVCNPENYYEFVYYSITHNGNRLKNMAGQTAVPIINKSVFEKFVIHKPKSYQEQQKIAKCLSSLDEVIAAECQKLEVFTEHKKGLLQNLFPQEGETVPKLRFKEFENNGDWEEKRLIELANKNVKWSFTGGPFGSNLKASDYTENGVRIIQLQNIGDGQFVDDYKIYTSIEKADELLGCNIYSGDLILSKMGDPVGRACIIPGVKNRFVMASDGIRLVVDEQRFSKYFVFSLINSVPFREKIEKEATGSTRKRIGLDDLREVEMLLPKKLTEQQKIAFILFSLDNLITAHTQEIAALKLHKKGLLQGLFPDVNDINE